MTEDSFPHFEEWYICARVSNRKHLTVDCLTSSAKYVKASLPFCFRVCYGPNQPPVQQFHTNRLLCLFTEALWPCDQAHTCKDTGVPKFRLETESECQRTPCGTGSSSLLISLIDKLYETETTKGNLSGVSFQNVQIHTDRNFPSLTLWKADYDPLILPPVCKKMQLAQYLQ